MYTLKLYNNWYEKGQEKGQEKVHCDGKNGTKLRLSKEQVKNINYIIRNSVVTNSNDEYTEYQLRTVLDAE